MQKLVARYLILFVFLCGLLSHLTAQHEEILGVYKYHLEDWEGISIISPTHFIWVITDKARMPFSNNPPSIAEKTLAFQAQNTAAGTWEASGKQRYKFTFTHNARAGQIGQSFEWEYTKEGDLLNYWILQEDGSKGPLNQARKLSDWNAPGSCSDFNGTWDYKNINGLYIQCGNYGAWIMLNELVTDRSSDEGKAKAFDALRGFAVIGDCSNKEKVFFNVIHNSDIREEKQVIGGTIGNLTDGKFTGHILNLKGEVTETSFTLRALNKK